MAFDMNPFAFGYGRQLPPMQDLNGTGMDINQQPQHPQQQQTPGNPTSMIKSLMNKDAPGTTSGATAEPAGLPDVAGAGTGMPDAAMGGAGSIAPETAGVGGEAAALGGGEMAGLGEAGAGLGEAGAGAAEGLGALGAGAAEGLGAAASGIGEAFAGFSAADLLPLLFLA